MINYYYQSTINLEHYLKLNKSNIYIFLNVFLGLSCLGGQLFAQQLKSYNSVFI